MGAACEASPESLDRPLGVDVVVLSAAAWVCRSFGEPEASKKIAAFDLVGLRVHLGEGGRVRE